MSKSRIEWTDRTWNPLTGCVKVSPGCDRCYAERFAERFRGVAGHPYEAGFDLKLRPERLEEPFRWRKPARVFVNSMSDLFQAGVPAQFIRRVFLTMGLAREHQFQVLTKRSGGMRRHVRRLADWPFPDWCALPFPLKNVWLGVSVEDAPRKSRIAHLRDTPAAVRFLSLEPLLEDVGDLDLGGIDWVIAGGESGPGARPMAPSWVRNARDQCVEAGVPFFFKQWGGPNKRVTGRELDGRTWDEYPGGQHGDS